MSLPCCLVKLIQTSSVLLTKNEISTKYIATPTWVDIATPTWVAVLVQDPLNKMFLNDYQYQAFNSYQLILINESY